MLSVLGMLSYLFLSAILRVGIITHFINGETELRDIQ